MEHKWLNQNPNKKKNQTVSECAYFEMKCNTSERS